MIKVMKSTDDPRYSGKTGPRPILNVTHAMGSLEITEFVRIAVETGHLKAVLEGLPKEYSTDARGGCYMVGKDRGQAPQDLHIWKDGDSKSAMDSAYEEAERLAKREPGVYRILRQVGIVKSESVPITEITYVTRSL